MGGSHRGELIWKSGSVGHGGLLSRGAGAKSDVRRGKATKLRNGPRPALANRVIDRGRVLLVHVLRDIFSLRNDISREFGVTREENNGIVFLGFIDYCEKNRGCQALARLICRPKNRNT